MKLLEQTFLFQFDFGVKFVCHYFNIERCSAHTVWEIPLLQCGKVLWKSQCWITADISMHCQRWQTFALRVLPILVCGEQFISILIYLVTVMYYVNNSSTSWLQIIVVVWLHIECRGNNSATSKLVHPVDGWYSKEGPLLAVPNVTAYPSTVSVPITVLLYDGPLLCGFNVAIKGLSLQIIIIITSVSETIRKPPLVKA